MKLPNNTVLINLLIQYYQAPTVKHICSGLLLNECYDFELSKLVNNHSKSDITNKLQTDYRLQRTIKWFYNLHNMNYRLHE